VHHERAAVVEGDRSAIAVEAARVEIDALVGNVPGAADRRAAAGAAENRASDFDECCLVLRR
jgi:hypothetical protein